MIDKCSEINEKTQKSILDKNHSELNCEGQNSNHLINNKDISKDLFCLPMSNSNTNVDSIYVFSDMDNLINNREKSDLQKNQNNKNLIVNSEEFLNTSFSINLNVSSEFILNNI